MKRPLPRHCEMFFTVAKEAELSYRALPQTVRYMAALQAHGGLTDAEAARVLGLERSSVNARRAPLVKAGLVVANGFRLGPTGRIRNVVWALANEQRQTA